MKEILKTYFGYDSFRPLQEEIINNVLQGNDTFALMPTGGGKSLCFQLPALKFSGITLVVSPLIALMKDQVDALKTNGISAEFINSSLTPTEILQIQKKAADGKIKILYVAPERLALDSFQEFLQSVSVKLIAIDEAHCISEWGHDFRPDYRALKLLKKQFSKVPIIALTATATPKVQKDIVNQLSLGSPKIFISSFDRKNLTMRVVEKQNTFEKLLSLVEKYKNEPSIIYCFSRKETEEIAARLREEGFAALPYHAGLNSKTRKHNQELFIKDEAQIIVATIAFGMGIDKPDVRLIVHYSFPKTIEGYYQEIGRAGRDGLPSECVLFYSYGDARKHEYFINQIQDAVEQEKRRKKLYQIIQYCETAECRRKYILRYFGEEYSSAKSGNTNGCGACDTCLTSRKLFNATEIAQKVLSCVIRVSSVGGAYNGARGFGKNYIADVLLGKNAQKIINNKHNTLSVFGIVKDFTKDEIKRVIKSLVAFNLLRVSAGEYPTLSITKKGFNFLKQKELLELPDARADFASEDRSALKQKERYDISLFEKLRILRKQIADKNSVPPFMIFSDAALQEMARYFPIDEDSFSRIEGVGSKKLKDFSKAFLSVISEHIKENNIQPIKVPTIKIPNRWQKSRVTGGKYNSELSERYAQTKEMILKKLPISEIAAKHKFKEGTIIVHIEKLILLGEDIDILYLKPPSERFEKIKAAFEKCGDEKLKPVFDFFKEKYSYDEIRLVKLFLK
ncbi:DNA helicase RecQ [Candidatus Parcubacteria bacterium]|nr:DNA helicase RecQ [Candidatus Parcubacteria bacterium]